MVAVADTYSWWKSWPLLTSTNLSSDVTGIYIWSARNFVTFALFCLLHHLYQTFWHLAMAFVQSATAPPQYSVLHCAALLLWDYLEMKCFQGSRPASLPFQLWLLAFASPRRSAIKIFASLVDLTSTNYWNPCTSDIYKFLKPCRSDIKSMGLSVADEGSMYAP